MVFNIATRKERDGNWVAEVLSVPGLQVFGPTQDATRTEAGKLAAILTDSGNRRTTLILGFYPGTIPRTSPLLLV